MGRKETRTRTSIGRFSLNSIGATPDRSSPAHANSQTRSSTHHPSAHASPVLAGNTQCMSHPPAAHLDTQFLPTQVPATVPPTPAMLHNWSAKDIPHTPPRRANPVFSNRENPRESRRDNRHNRPHLLLPTSFPAATTAGDTQLPPETSPTRTTHTTRRDPAN
jgi:hypothetical protein